jgi:hypothetical protein
MNRIILVRAKNVGRMLKSSQNAIRMTLYYPPTPSFDLLRITVELCHLIRVYRKI